MPEPLLLPGPQRSGDSAAEPLLLLPGMLCGHSLWSDAVAFLPPEVPIFFARVDASDSIGGIAQAILAEAPPTFALAGHSLGGIVALEITREAPERVSRLALLNTSALAPTAVQLTAWNELTRRVTGGQFDQIAAEQPGLLLPSHRLLDAPLTKRVAEMARSVGADAFLRQLEAQRARGDLRPALGRMSQPALVVAGAEDQVCPLARQLELVGALPAPTLAKLPATGHLSPMESPEAVGRLLRGWLEA